MNVWYTVSDVVSLNQFGEESGPLSVYAFDRFETKEEAEENIPKVRGRFRAKAIIATVEWTPQFWKQFYEEKKPIETVKVSK
jgi:hypothetical protein